MIHAACDPAHKFDGAFARQDTLHDNVRQAKGPARNNGWTPAFALEHGQSEQIGQRHRRTTVDGYFPQMVFQREYNCPGDFTSRLDQEQCQSATPGNSE